MAALPRLLAAALRRHAQRQWTIFGWMGLPMILIFLLSAAWTAMLAAIQLAPTAVANYLMGTSEFDYGEFWLLSRADDDIAVASAVLLFAFAAGYVWLVMRMVFADAFPVPRVPRWFWRDRRVVIIPASTSLSASVSDARIVAKPMGPSLLDIIPAEASAKAPQPRWHDALRTLGHRLFASTLEEFDNSVYALPKLIMQSTTLIQYLRDGFPPFLILNYATLLAINWLIACDRSLHHRPDPRFVRRCVFFSFDLFFAVLAPLLVLVYAYNHFAFDRDVFATRTETLEPGSFDRMARLFADPTQVSLFRIAFQAMQLTSPTSLLIKVVLNVFTLRKWNETIVALVALPRPSPSTSTPSVNRGMSSQHSHVAPPLLLRHPRFKRAFRRLLAVGFATAGAGLFVYAIVAVVSSRHVCSAFPRCHVPSYRWNVGAHSCSCVVFVDRETRVRSFADWADLPDTTAHLAAVAATGDLRIIQIINRQVAALPDELARCLGLEQLILIHTRTLAFPDWAPALTNLQYLHVEGDTTPKQLTYLPSGLFTNMPRLRFVHLGCLLQLAQLPPFGNLPRLRYLVLALLKAIREIPRLDRLRDLRQLYIIDAIGVTTLPTVSALTNLDTFVLAGRSPLCCNGFLTGECDLSSPFCLDRSALGGPRVTCATEHIARDDYARLNATQGAVCDAPPAGLDASTPGDTDNDPCGGVEYKQCTQNGSVGICFAGAMNPISCQLGPAFIAMRRLQIQRNVGDACDPVMEAWLGCTGSS